MANYWSEAKSTWLRRTTVADEISAWAIEPIDKNEQSIKSLEESLNSDNDSESSFKDIEGRLAILRKNIKKEISSRNLF